MVLAIIVSFSRLAFLLKNKLLARFWYQQRRWLLLVILMAITVLGVACLNIDQPPRLYSTAATIGTTCGSKLGGATDNPVAAFYGDEAPTWVDDLPWACVFNINDYAGRSDQMRFEAAQAAAIAAGGGVVYLPQGTYRFDEDLILADGILVRGDIGSTLSAKAETFQPLTHLEFPKYEPSFSGNGTPNQTAFKQIRSQSPDTDSNQGLVFLDINRGAIALLGNVDRGTMSRRLVFGIRSNNVAEPDEQVPDSGFQPPWVRFSNRFAANIRLTVQADALVANNRLNDAVTDTYEQPGYVVQAQNQNDLVTYANGGRVPFNYTDHYGIVVNRSKPEGFRYARSAADEPGLFRHQITIRDNWVFKTMRVGIHAAGQGLVIRNNDVHDQAEKTTWVDPTGKRQPRGAMTFENRAIDWSGHDVRIEGNTYDVYRHRIMESQYFSTDGEGILTQQCCGGTSVERVTIHNNRGRGYIGIYKVPDINQLTISENQVRSPSSNFPTIYVNADTNNAPGSMSGVTITANQLEGGILAQASGGGNNNYVNNNRGRGVLKRSCHVQIEQNTGFEIQPCQE